MKLNKINSLIAFAFMTILIISCAESDKVYDQVTENVERGAVLRQISNNSVPVVINSDTKEIINDDGKFDFVLEYQDHEGNSLLDDMEVYLAFNDNTDDDDDFSKAEILHETISGSSFSNGDRGLPQFTYSISTDELLSALGVSGSSLSIGGDQFVIRFKINLSDGRSFSTENNSGTITGSYFASPFTNFLNVVCGPTVPTAGTWTFETVDAWGDGWNGGSISVILDGTEAGKVANSVMAATTPTSTTEIIEFEVPEGTQVISLMYNAGDFDEEVTFIVTSANGNVVLEAGPEPPVDVELLDYCRGGL
ncbi:MAG: hypothetical protein AAGA77_21725 [Bacteroidota bacterium]